MTDVEGLLPFCETDSQRRLIQTIVREGSISKAGPALGFNRRTVQRALDGIRRNAARRGYAPESQMTRPVSPAHVAETSTMYDADGNVKLQWVKAKLSTSDAFQALQEAIQQAADEYRGVAKPVKAPARSDAELLTVYPMGDPHVGMYAWKDEAGEDFDCDIARQDLLSATSRLVQVAPGSERALIVNLPGKPKSIRECLDAVMPAVPYCLDLIGAARMDCHPDKVAVGAESRLPDHDRSGGARAPQAPEGGGHQRDRQSR